MMRTSTLVLSCLAAVSAFAPVTTGRPGPRQLRRASVSMETLFEEYMKAREGQGSPATEMATRDPSMDTRDPEPPAAIPAPAQAPPAAQTPIPATFQASQGPQDSDPEYERVPFWKQSSEFTEAQRAERRTIFMHNDWKRHRSSDRFLRNIKTIPSSGINQALSKELAFVTFTATFVVAFNMLFYQYQDLSGAMHPGAIATLGKLSLPALPFTIAMPALSLLITFRANQGYSRWNEARTLWGGLINNCRNVVRQTNTFFPDDEVHDVLKNRMAADTKAFIMSLRNFLRGPTDDATLRGELYELVDAGRMTPTQADSIMSAANRPMFCLSAMSATLRKANLDSMQTASIDRTISTLVDLTGANERIFKSPIPLVYTRLTSRFLSLFLILLPLGLWGALGDSWNHWATIPAEFIIAFFLFGIEEIGISTEEPFSILPLEAFCNGAISATNEEMLKGVRGEIFEGELPTPVK